MKEAKTKNSERNVMKKKLRTNKIAVACLSNILKSHTNTIS
jgi:hypothetical protein